MENNKHYIYTLDVKNAAVVLLDVPYRWEMRAEGSCRIYGHEMNNDEHRKLLSVCKDAQCKIMLFGYRSECDPASKMYLK